ncbi:MAG: hypothetical protein HC852_15340 [Acaryochloridaceae cyanobacterium RU_4_10]|nr:hypothetical protein [Acaryochloridaceae cyanobacterium RU_4_10]
MKHYSRCFGRLLQADLPQERVLSYMIVLLAIAYVGLTWTGQASSACADVNPGASLHVSAQPLSCQ